MIGRLVHYAVDAALVSTIVAGVRRSSGFTLDPAQISDPTARSIIEKYLGVGETVFDVIQSTAMKSSYFKKK